MKNHDVYFLAEALEDLEEIILFIAQDKKKAAIQMHDEIIKRANHLSSFPKIGRLIPDKKMSEAGYRMLGVKPYILFYRIIDEKVFIYRILHGASNYQMLYSIMTKTDFEIK